MKLRFELILTGRNGGYCITCRYASNQHRCIKGVAMTAKLEDGICNRYRTMYKRIK